MHGVGSIMIWGTSELNCVNSSSQFWLNPYVCQTAKDRFLFSFFSHHDAVSHGMYLNQQRMSLIFEVMKWPSKSLKLNLAGKTSIDL